MDPLTISILIACLVFGAGFVTLTVLSQRTKEEVKPQLIVLRNASVKILEVRVQEHLDNGWHLHGVMYAFAGKLHQAMVKNTYHPFEL